MTREGFEPAIPAAKLPQTYALDRAATGIGICDLHNDAFSVTQTIYIYIYIYTYIHIYIHTYLHTYKLK
jgi:hypothetical protein